MAGEPSLLMQTSSQDQTQDFVNTAQNSGHFCKPSSSQEGSSSQFNLPDGWIIEERPRRTKPSHVDRVYFSSILLIHACMYIMWLYEPIKFCISSNHRI